MEMVSLIFHVDVQSLVWWICLWPFLGGRLLQLWFKILSKVPVLCAFYPVTGPRILLRDSLYKDQVFDIVVDALRKFWKLRYVITDVWLSIVNMMLHPWNGQNFITLFFHHWAFFTLHQLFGPFPLAGVAVELKCFQGWSLYVWSHGKREITWLFAKQVGKLWLAVAYLKMKIPELWIWCFNLQ